jgi:hypothetical protein
MKTARVIGLTLICLAIGMSQALAQYGDPQYVRRLGGNAWVASVDQPENCLRIRSGPGTNFEIIGCAQFGDQLLLSGLWTQDNWAEVVQPVRGWVSGNQIRLNRVVASVTPTVVSQFCSPDDTYVNCYPRRWAGTSFWPGRVWPGFWGHYWWRHHRHHPFFRGGQVKAGVWRGSHIKSGSWGRSHIRSGAWSGSRIRSGNWGGSHIRAGAWGGSHIRAGAWGGSHIRAGAWGGSHMRSGSFGGSRGMGMRAGSMGFSGGHHGGGRGRGR